VLVNLPEGKVGCCRMPWKVNLLGECLTNSQTKRPMLGRVFRFAIPLQSKRALEVPISEGLLEGFGRGATS